MKFTQHDFVTAIHELVNERKLILCTTAVTTILGVVIALNQPKDYTSQVLLAPELTNTNRMSESLGSLTSMIGIDLNSMNNHNVDAIYPEIYPKVVTSPDFIVDLWDCPVTLADGSRKTYYDHITQDGFTPFWSYPGIWISSLFSSDDEEASDDGQPSTPNPRNFSRKQELVCSAMASKIMCDVSSDNGLITITVIDEDPNVACDIADTVQNKLQQYITRYRTQKARNDYEYSLKLVNEAREEYLAAQRAAASFADANISVFKQKVLIQKDVLQNEFQLKYNTYNALSQQCQNAKALIQAATPVYTTIRRAAIPNQSSSTPRSTTVLLYLLMGFFLSIIWILFGRDYLRQLKAAYRNAGKKAN